VHETLIFLEKVGTFCPEKRGESEMWEVHHWFWGSTPLPIHIIAIVISRFLKRPNSIVVG